MHDGDVRPVPASPRIRRRDRHGRGVRGLLAPPGVPLRRSRAQQFSDLVVEAIAQLERLRDAGAAFLVFPRTGLWWLEHYRGLREHLEQEYTPLVVDEETGAIFELRPPPALKREVA